jgi:hypothetical protein
MSAPHVSIADRAESVFRDMAREIGEITGGELIVEIEQMDGTPYALWRVTVDWGSDSETVEKINGQWVNGMLMGLRMAAEAMRRV